MLAEFDIEGNAKVLRIVKGLGYGLDENAVAAIQGWRFAPAYQSGRRVSVIANIDVVFSLRQDDEMVRQLLLTFWMNAQDLQGAQKTKPPYKP